MTKMFENFLQEIDPHGVKIQKTEDLETFEESQADVVYNSFGTLFSNLFIIYVL